MSARNDTTRHTAQDTTSKWPRLALAIGAFGIGTTEFSPMGLLPVIAEGVDVSIPTAGLLVSAYAVGVMIGAPLITLLFSQFGKRAALIGLMLIVTLGNLLSALAPDYWSLLAARVFTSLNHGAFFGLGAVVAASLVPREKQASAIATMFMGLTIANIGGVPAATWLGQIVGWRFAFAGTAALGLLTIAALWATLPAGERGTRPEVRKELSVLIRPQVLMALMTTVMGSAAMFTLYTYVSPLLTDVAGAPLAMVTPALMLIGLGFTVGNWLGGRLADWSVDGAAAIALLALASLMLAAPITMATLPGTMLTMFFWGLAAFALVPPVQIRVMQAAAEAPGLASSVNIGAFNFGNAIGAALGGAVIGLGWGYAMVPVAGGLMAFAGLLFVWQGGRGASPAQA